MKKQKSLTKKIERLKTRLAKDAKKLAKLTMKLGAAMTGKKTAKRKPAARAPKAKKPVSKAPAKAAAATPKPAPKKKLNLTPERRAQLAAAMKARWEAKKAAATSARDNSGNQGTSSGDGSQQ